MLHLTQHKAVGLRELTVSDGGAQMKDLIRMEGLVLQSLDFRVNAPTCFTFYSVLLRHLQPAAKTAALASYILVSSSFYGPNASLSCRRPSCACSDEVQPICRA